MAHPSPPLGLFMLLFATAILAPDSSPASPRNSASLPAAGSAPPAASRLQIAFRSPAREDGFGFSVGTAGDLNGDGFADAIVGAQDTTRVFFGGPRADAIADLRLAGGRSVGTAGDVNGDGYADVIVGFDHAYVYYGGRTPDSEVDLILQEDGFVDGFAWSVGTAGDVDGDGYADLVVGDPFDDSGGVDAGRVYVYHGGPNQDAVADLVLTGSADGDGLGWSVGTAGDVNGDGYADLIVGALLNGDGTFTGRAYIYFGGPSADRAADLTLTAEATGDRFGWSVGTAGDVNGDGYDDVIVGAVFNSANGVAAGRAYVYYGGSAMDDGADLVFTGEAESDRFGVSVGAAGDVNGDGYFDLIVGAYANGEGGEQAGRAYVFYGGPGTDAIPDHTITGSTDGRRLGEAVGTAGDMNGDGFADVIVGGPWKEGAGPAEGGVAFVYDMNRYFVIAPNGREIWSVEGFETVSWLGAEPADIWLSVDDGKTFELQLARVGGRESNIVTLRAPRTFTNLARICIRPNDGRVGGKDQSDSCFTIQSPATVSVPPIAAWPVPYREGSLSIKFATYGGSGGGPGPGALALYDISGKLVREIAHGTYDTGFESTAWDGRDKRGLKVATGVYFLRSSSAGVDRALKIVVTR